MRTRITNNYITVIGKGRSLRFWIVPFIVLVAFLSIIAMALRAFAQAVASDDPQWAAVGVTMVAGAAYIYRFVHRALVSFNWYRGIFYGWHVNLLLKDGKGDVAASIEKSVGDLAKKTEILHRFIADQIIQSSTKDGNWSLLVGPSPEGLVDIGSSIMGRVALETWLKGNLEKIPTLGEKYMIVAVSAPTGPRSSYDGEVIFYCKYTAEVEKAFGTGPFEDKMLYFEMPPVGRGKMMVVDDDSNDDRMRVIKGLVILDNGTD